MTPVIRLNWWNTISDRPQIASLDERKFMAFYHCKQHLSLEATTLTKKPSSNVKNVLAHFIAKDIIYCRSRRCTTDANSGYSLVLQKSASVCVMSATTYGKRFKRCCLRNDPLFSLSGVISLGIATLRSTLHLPGTATFLCHQLKN